MHILIKYMTDVISREMNRLERNFLSELRLTEAILRSDITELNTKIERIQQGVNGKTPKTS